MSAPRRLAATAALALLLLALGAGSAAAAPPLMPSDVRLEVLNSAGAPESRAGAHPDRFVAAVSAHPESAEDLKDLVVELPPGLGGDPRAVPLCPRAVFDESAVFGAGCPPESQVGVATIETEAETQTLRIYSVEPAPNEAATFGMASFLVATKIAGRLRPADQGLSLALSDITQTEAKLVESRLEFWGVPADHQEGTSIPRRALLTNPTRCGSPLAATIRVRSWRDPGNWVSASASTGAPIGGCEDLRFEPRVEFGLGDAVVDSPTGVELGLTVPGGDDPDGRAGAQIRRVSIDLPAGMALSPGGAVGFAACTDAQLGTGNEDDPACPPASRLGSVELVAPQLSVPLRGAVYLGAGLPDDRFRLFVAARGGGASAKFAGSLRPDPVSGRVVVVLDNLPQVTFSRLVMRLDGGPRALLATPLDCEPARVSATFESYAGGPPVRSSAAAPIGASPGSPCGANPFEPVFEGGASSDRAGRPTSLSVTIRRRDGEQLADRFSVSFPAGLSARLGAVATCPAPASPGECPAASRVGSAVAEVGSGPSPAQLQGDVFLAGPYRRAPFSLLLSFDAALGPFDLGRLAVRAALRMDPLTGRVTVETDPLPRSVEGVPVRFRTVGLDIDRPGFIRNPTSCGPASVSASLRATGGASVLRASPFATGGCVRLPFRPSFAMALTRRAELREGGKPGLRIAGRMPARGANLKAARIALPGLLRFDSGGLRAICPRRDAFDGDCPLGSRVGSASGSTPLLKEPLRGSVHVVQPRGTGSPDLWASLGGGGIRVEMRSETVARDGGIETRLVDLPDVPLSRFALRLAGGEHGVLRLRRGLCAGGEARSLGTTIEAEGQNGARREIRQRIAAPLRCAGEPAGRSGRSDRAVRGG